MQKKVLKVNPKDNIIVALTDLPAGEIVHLDGADYTVLKDTKAKHKFAADNFVVGDHIIYIWRNRWKSESAHPKRRSYHD